MATKSYRVALYVSAAISLAAAIIHTSWHWTLTDVPVLSGMSPVQGQTLLLMNAAIALLLAYLTVQAVIVARAAASMPLSTLRALTLLLISFWLARFALELVMPVQFPVLSPAEPPIVAKLIMILPALVLCIPVVMEISGRRSPSF